MRDNKEGWIKQGGGVVFVLAIGKRKANRWIKQPATCAPPLIPRIRLIRIINTNSIN